MKTIDDILKVLKDRWPQIELKFAPQHKSMTILYANNKSLLHFNEEQVVHDLEFFRDRDDFVEIALSLFEKKIREYWKKESRTVKSGKGSKGLNIQQIKESAAATLSGAAAARYLHVHYLTWRKYARMYIKADDPEGRTYYELQLNKAGKDIRKARSFVGGPFGYTIQDVLDGKVRSDYPAWQLRKRLVRLGLVRDECALCGFEEHRLTDNKVPLLLAYKDRNPDNKKAENLELLCYNCYYLTVGNIYRNKKTGTNQLLEKYRKNKEQKETIG